VNRLSKGRGMGEGEGEGKGGGLGRRGGEEGEPVNILQRKLFRPLMISVTLRSICM